MSHDARTVEGIARVVGVDADGGAWLEPEQTTSCGHCASAGLCGPGGIGTVAGRLAARRFRIDGAAALRVGDRVVVGIDDLALVKGALTAYALPLLVSFAVGGAAQAVAGSDLVTLAGMCWGLGAGLVAARLLARRMARAGALAPRLVRLAATGEGCSPRQATP